jgi:GINS complex subunit 4
VGQIELVEEQTGNMDPKTNFKLIVVQTELERFRFMVRSVLRARIAKVNRPRLDIDLVTWNSPLILGPVNLTIA